MKNHCKDIQILLIQAEANMSLLLLQLEEQKMETRSRPEKGVPVQPVPVTRNGVSFIRWVDGNGWPAPNPDKVCKGNVPKMEAIPTNVSKKFEQDGWSNQGVSGTCFDQESCKKLLEEMKKMNLDAHPRSVKDEIIDNFKTIKNGIKEQFGKIVEGLDTELRNIEANVRESGFGKTLESLSKFMEVPLTRAGALMKETAIVVGAVALGAAVFAAVVNFPIAAINTISYGLLGMVVLSSIGRSLVSSAYLKEEQEKLDQIKDKLIKFEEEKQEITAEKMMDLLNIDLRSIDMILEFKVLTKKSDFEKALKELNPSYLAELKQLLSDYDLTKPGGLKDFYTKLAKLRSDISKDLAQIIAPPKNPDSDKKPLEGQSEPIKSL